MIRIKTDEEIEKMRRAEEVTCLLDDLFDIIKEGADCEQ